MCEVKYVDFCESYKEFLFISLVSAHLLVKLSLGNGRGGLNSTLALRTIWEETIVTV